MYFTHCYLAAVIPHLLDIEVSVDTALVASGGFSDVGSVSLAALINERMFKNRWVQY